MDSSKKTVSKINEWLKITQKPHSMRTKDNGTVVLPGQLWKTHREESERPTWLLLLMEQVDDGLFNAVPVFRWTELAGPCDIYLPAHLVGRTLIASLELECTITADTLDECEERFSSETLDFLREARSVIDDDNLRQKFLWGRTYYGKHSLRLEYHEYISKEIERLQLNVIDRLDGITFISEETEMQRVGKAIILEWPKALVEKRKTALAAEDTTLDAQTLSTLSVGNTDLLLEISAHSNMADCVICIYDTEGRLSGGLAGYTIENLAGNKSHTVSEAQSVLPLEMITNGFILLDPDGQAVDLQVVS